MTDYNLYVVTTEEYAQQNLKTRDYVTTPGVSLSGLRFVNAYVSIAALKKHGGDPKFTQWLNEVVYCRTLPAEIK